MNKIIFGVMLFFTAYLIMPASYAEYSFTSIYPPQQITCKPDATQKSGLYCDLEHARFNANMPDSKITQSTQFVFDSAQASRGTDISGHVGQFFIAYIYHAVTDPNVKLFVTPNPWGVILDDTSERGFVPAVFAPNNKWGTLLPGNHQCPLDGGTLCFCNVDRSTPATTDECPIANFAFPAVLPTSNPVTFQVIINNDSDTQFTVGESYWNQWDSLRIAGGNTKVIKPHEDNVVVATGDANGFPTENAARLYIHGGTDKLMISGNTELMALKVISGSSQDAEIGAPIQVANKSFRLDFPYLENNVIYFKINISNQSKNAASIGEKKKYIVKHMY